MVEPFKVCFWLSTCSANTWRDNIWFLGQSFPYKPHLNDSVTVLTIRMAFLTVDIAATSSSGVARTLENKQWHTKILFQLCCFISAAIVWTKMNTRTWVLHVIVVEQPTFGPQRRPLVTQQISVWQTVQRSQSQPSLFCTMMPHWGQCIASPDCTKVC